MYSMTRVERSPEESFNLAQLPPTTHNSALKNTYYLQVKLGYSAKTCDTYDPLPSASLELMIIPHTDPQRFNLQQPENFDPEVLSQIKFGLQRIK